MKSWQIILINGCVTVLAVFVAVGIFIPDAPPDKTKELQESLDAQFKVVQLKLNIIEEAILKQKERVLISPAYGGSAKNSEALGKLERKLDMILGKLAVLENRGTGTRGSQTFGRSFRPPMKPPQLPPQLSAKGQSPSSWIDDLPEDKKREVEIIFEEHLQRMRDNLPPPDPDGRPPDRETVIRVVKENGLLLKQELKGILNEKEYQQFLDAHPEPSIQSPRLPAVRGNP
ncbi:MAG: hypothetical protein B6240_11455 [Desulfobacteraceae bacterium 4572_87]|nr:MAG: hypothetical protein B6240_11455 [Desulfobacteraceae bacterium 4572_87]